MVSEKMKERKIPKNSAWGDIHFVPENGRIGKNINPFMQNAKMIHLSCHYYVK
jgi:hypothetical protein